MAERQGLSHPWIDPDPLRLAESEEWQQQPQPSGVKLTVATGGVEIRRSWGADKAASEPPQSNPK